MRIIASTVLAVLLAACGTPAERGAAPSNDQADFSNAYHMDCMRIAQKMVGYPDERVENACRSDKSGSGQ